MFALLLLSAAPIEDAATLIARSATVIAGERCAPDANKTDITVCGLRRADRFRVPLVTRTVDRRDQVADNRAALVHARTAIEERGPFLVGGGAAGATVTTRFGPGAGAGETTASGMRPPAP